MGEENTYGMKFWTHHLDSSREQICRLHHLLLLLYLGLQLSRADLVLGEQDGGRKLRLLLEKQNTNSSLTRM